MEIGPLPPSSLLPHLSSAGAKRVRLIASQQVERISRRLEEPTQRLLQNDLHGLQLQELTMFDRDPNAARQEAMGTLYGRGLEMAHLNMLALNDACHGFVDLTQAANSVASVLPVARSGLEAGVGLAWMLDPALNGHQRLVRMAAAFWVEVTHSETMREYVDPAERDVMSRRAAEFEALVGLAGIRSVETDAGRKFWAPRAQKSQSGRINMTNAVQDDPELLGMWRLTSGGAHARPWLIGGELQTSAADAHAPHMVAASCLIRACGMAARAVHLFCADDAFTDAPHFDAAVQAVRLSLLDSMHL